MCEHVYTEQQGGKDGALGNTIGHHHSWNGSVWQVRFNPVWDGVLMADSFVKAIQSNLMIDSQMENYNQVVFLFVIMLRGEQLIRFYQH